jgi:hypothetical protein
VRHWSDYPTMLVDGGWWMVDGWWMMYVDEAMMRLIREILKVSHANAPPTTGKTVTLDANPENAAEVKEEGGCCS